MLHRAVMPGPQLTENTPFYVVLNAASGSGDAREAQTKIAETMQGARRRCEFLVVENPAQLPDIAQRAVDAALHHGGAVVAAGGDGTINALTQVALPLNLPFGIVPRGTFNYSSRAHSIPLDIDEAARALLHARLKPVQVGLVNDRVFLVNASLGLYPQLLQDREQFKRTFGRKRVVAIWSALATVLKGYRQLTLDLECDGQREALRTPTLFVGNNPLQLEQVGLPEAEDVQQRRLAGVLVRPVGTATLLWLALRGALGKLGDDDNVRNFAFKDLIVHHVRREHPRGVKVALDGELTRMHTPLHFRVAPEPLFLIVPSES